MKFQAEIEIEKPIKHVVALFSDPSNTIKWLEGLKSTTLISGNLGEPGSKSKVIFETPAGRMQLMETIISKNLPDEYVIRYEGDGYVGYTKHQFIKVDKTLTKFISSQDVELQGALKFVGGLISGTIKKQLERSTVCFKNFAESH